MRALEDRRLMVVEDEYMLADDLRRALDAAGADVIGPFRNQRAALEALASGESVDGAVLDINLDGDSSMTLAERLREMEIPFVFATGYGEPSIDKAYAEVPLWEKPYDAAALAAALADMLRRAGRSGG